MHDATQLATADDLELARRIIEEAINDVQSSGATEAEYKQYTDDLEACLHGLQDKVTFESDGLATLRSTSTAHFTQRSNSSGKNYQTSQQDAMLRRFEE